MLPLRSLQIAFAHYPLNTVVHPDGGSRGSRRLTRVLQSHRVAAFLSGHLHTLFGKQVTSLGRRGTRDSTRPPSFANSTDACLDSVDSLCAPSRAWSARLRPNTRRIEIESNVPPPPVRRGAARLTQRCRASAVVLCRVARATGAGVVRSYEK